MMQRGISVLEIIITIAISVILILAAVPFFSNPTSGPRLDSTLFELIQTLRLAHTRAQASLDDSAHGVKFLPDSYVLYQGASYATRVSSFDRVFSLEDGITILLSLTGSGDPGDINFSKGFGAPQKTGSLILSSIDGGSREVRIYSTGLIEEN